MTYEEEVTKQTSDAPNNCLANQGKFTCSDGILNLLCWFTIYPNKFIATFFRQLCLCGCAVSKKLNNNNVQTVYCCPAERESNLYHPMHWDMDRVTSANQYWICCEPKYTDDNVFISNWCGHCYDNIHYTSKYNNPILIIFSHFLCLSTFFLIKLPGFIIYVLIIIIAVVIIILLLIFGVIMIIPFIPLIFMVFLIIILYQCSCNTTQVISNP